MQNGWKFIEIFEKIDEEIIYQAGRPWKQKNRFGRCIKAAGIILILLLGITGIFHAQVKAGIEKFISYISQALGIEEDLSDYTEIQNQTISKNGLSVTLLETVMDPKELDISYLVENHTGQRVEMSLIESSVWLDGERIVSCGYQSGLEGEDREDTYHIIGTFRLEEPLVKKDSVDIRTLLVFTREDGSMAGEFEYEFTASCADIKADTVEIPLEQTIEGDGEELRLKNFTLNGLESTITGVSENLKSDNYWLKGTDSLGNPVEYRQRRYYVPNTEFELDRKESFISPEAEWIELQLYAHDDVEVMLSKEMDGVSEESYYESDYDSDSDSDYDSGYDSDYAEGESYDADPDEEHTVGKSFRIQIKGK